MTDSSASDASSVLCSEQRRSCVCDVCGVKLSRPAHLERHMKRHSSTILKSFHCHMCDRSFSRKDVYQRHKRSVHDPNQSARREGRRKSCSRCIRYKLRCSRETPCTACRNRPEQCTYSSGSSEHVSDSNLFPSEAPVLVEPGRPLNLDDLADAANISHYSTTFVGSSGVPSLNPHERINGQGTALSPVSNIDPEFATTEEPQSNSSVLGFPQPPGSHEGNLSLSNYEVGISFHQATDQTCTSNEDEHLTLEGGGERRHRTQVTNPYNGPPWFEFQLDPLQLDLSGWDTLLGCDTDLDLESPGLSIGGPAPEASEHPLEGTIPIHSRQPFPKDVSSSSDPDSTLRCGQTPDPELHNGKNIDGRDHWPAVLDQGGNETWPFDYTSNQGFRKIKLPPLKEVLEETISCRPGIQPNILGDLIKVLSAPRIPSLNDTPALETMPAVAFLGEFTRLFFAEFHNFCPVIHVPTWRIEKCPTYLLAAIACIGATFSLSEGANELAALFAEITQRALFWAGQQDSSAFRNTEYITASCLHQMYALGTGNRRLYEIADASRGLLVTSLRGLGVLATESSSSLSDTLAFDPQKLKAMDRDELEEVWQSWRERETAKRMAWSVFEFDCTMSTMTSKRAAFRIAELPPRLPCSDSMWEAHSARAWAALVSFATSSPAGLPFYPVLREAVANGKVTDQAPRWAVRLCVISMGRILYDIKEIQDASAPGILGIPYVTEAHQETRQKLLTSLESLESSLAKPMCTADVVHLNVLRLAYHRSHLINSGDETMDLVVTIFRNSGVDNHHASLRSVEAAKDFLQGIFRNRPVHTRRLVFHASAIIAISRDCKINTPCETLSVFMGYALLLAYVKYFPFTVLDHSIIPDSTVPIKLDEVPWMRGPQGTQQITMWIRRGGAASLGSIENICNQQSFIEAKKAARAALGDLNVWGLARKFRQTVARFT